MRSLVYSSSSPLELDSTSALKEPLTLSFNDSESSLSSRFDLVPATSSIFSSFPMLSSLSLTLVGDLGYEDPEMIGLFPISFFIMSETCFSSFLIFLSIIPFDIVPWSSIFWSSVFYILGIAIDFNDCISLINIWTCCCIFLLDFLDVLVFPSSGSSSSGPIVIPADTFCITSSFSSTSMNFLPTSTCDFRAFLPRFASISLSFLNLNSYSANFF